MCYRHNLTRHLTDFKPSTRLPLQGGRLMLPSKTLLFWLGVLFLLSLATVRASACGCLKIEEEGPYECGSKSPPCESEYYREFPAYGCLWSDAIVTGYGDCCGTEVQTLGLDVSNSQSHDGCTCGQARVHRSSALSANHARRGRPGGVINGVAAAYSQEEVLFVPDRCRHTYAMVFTHDLALVTNSLQDRR